jgi:tRNA pseudouridine13 synthase
VVLPLPGGKVVYPQHETAQVYIDTAAADGVSLEEAPHAVKEFQITFLVGPHLYYLLVCE